MIVLLVVVIVAVALGVALLVAMLGRDEPHLGLWALTVLLVAGVMATVYAVLDS